MKVVKAIALLGTLAMTGVLIYGFTAGNFTEEGSRLLAMPWGVVSLVDLYTGFILFSCWITFRERSLARSAIWIILMMVLGFFTASLYTFLALHSSHGDWHKFWFGKRV